MAAYQGYAQTGGGGYDDYTQQQGGAADGGYNDYGDDGGYDSMDAQQQQQLQRPQIVSSENFLLPDSVKDFVFDLHDAMRRSQKVDELELLYNVTGKQLSDAYFKQTPWPETEVIADQCDHDEVFLCFYNEMRTRHMMTTLPNGVTLEDKQTAWTNYCRLFDALLDCRDTDVIISAQWAFDIIHEFVYQFQGFCQFRTQLDKRNAEEKATLSANQDVWAVQNVISYLHGLIRASNIVPILEAKRNSASDKPPPPPPSQLHQMMGYFAIIGMSRLQCLLSDYHDCLKVLDPIDLSDKNELFASNVQSYISTCMHAGFSLLMLRRYHDASKMFSEILSHIIRMNKTGQLQRGGNGLAEQVGKLADKMSSLLAISYSLAPDVIIDDQVRNDMKHKQHDVLDRMALGEKEAFMDKFRWAAPKAIVSCIPDYHVGLTTANDAVEMQTSLFGKEIQQQMTFPQVRSYLKLYTTIGIEKMARFNGLQPEQFRQLLVSLKMKMLQMEWGLSSDSGPLDGKQQLALDFNYYVDGGVIHIDEAPKEQRFEKYFLTQINKCEYTINQVARIKF